MKYVSGNIPYIPGKECIPFSRPSQIRTENRNAFNTIHHTKIVLKGGLGSGNGAYLPKGSTLKAITVIFSNEVCSNFTAMSSRTLLSTLVVSGIKRQEVLEIEPEVSDNILSPYSG
jgi:hypothetical protein